jgi:hypothetical protein
MNSSSDILIRAQRWVNAITYKPNHHFFVKWDYDEWRDDRQMLVVTMVVRAPDVDDPKNITSIMSPVKVDPVIVGANQRSTFNRIIEGLVNDFERHEMEEWLKIDGRRLNDPHPEARREVRLPSVSSDAGDASEPLPDSPSGRQPQR